MYILQSEDDDVVAGAGAVARAPAADAHVLADVVVPAAAAGDALAVAVQFESVQDLQS